MIADVYFVEFLKPDLSDVGGGGIGTLIMHLIPILQECGHDVRVFQSANERFLQEWHGAKVYGVPLFVGRDGSNETVAKAFMDFASSTAEASARFEIFAADFFSHWNNNPLAIAVQNGIAWDASLQLAGSRNGRMPRWKEHLIRWRNQERGLRRFERCFNRVAVDLYFLNWYRSFRGPDYPGRVYYNPNPAPPMEWNPSREELHPGKVVRIIMARRMVPEKGTRLAARVFRRLLSERREVQITFAGEGPERPYLEEQFRGESRVAFTVFPPSEAAKVHHDHDIAVIPSLCGEATCLAVLEAMAAGCAVVATHMGGTITQILDGYSGSLCWPREEDLFQALLALVDNPDRRLQLARRGWEVSQRVFPQALWRHRWKIILGEILEGRDAATEAMAKEWRPNLLDRCQRLRLMLRNSDRG